MTTLKRWQNILAQLHLTESPHTYDQLTAAYSEPPRAYHNLTHISECLAKLDWAASHYGEADPLIELAIWFHDAVYDVRAKDNEQKSADWAAAFMKASGARAAAIDRVYSLILATRHGEPQSESDHQLITDIDLAILGADPLRFNEYESQIREEYNWVTPEDYSKGRTAVLRGFLERERIFRLDQFYEIFEEKARGNLEMLINRLL